MFPTALLFLRIIIHYNVIYIITWVISWSGFRLMMIYFVVSLVITFMNQKTLIKWFRSILIGLGIFVVFLSILFNGLRTATEIMDKGPFFSSYKLSLWESLENLFDLCLFEFGELVLNVTIVLMSASCPWIRLEEGKRDDLKHEVWNSKKYMYFCKCLVKCLVIGACMNFAIIFAKTVVVFAFEDVNEPTVFMVFGCKLIIDRVIWIVIFLLTVLMQLLAFCQYKKKIIGVINKSPNDNSYALP